ncbi:peptidase M22, glycoprotease [Hymenopellis radicata]|nr:peptidase M22, glycoprotease [Hymenopellis radicata]
MFSVLSRTRCRRVVCPDIFRRFTVLAFESSADDTCAAVVTSDRKILANVVIKQDEVHSQYGGIQPASAVLAHQRNMPVAAKRALNDAGLDISGIDGIAFTRGPGMGVCLGVACNAAKTLAAITNKPLVGVHHMQAHALTPLLTSYPDIPTFPFLTLLVSGGHTLLLLATSVDSFRIIATTRDESIGRTIDKVTRLLGLGWNGIALEQFYNTTTEEAEIPQDWIPFATNTMAGQMGYSFSGFHSHVERYVHKHGVETLTTGQKLGVAKEFMKVVIDHLEAKLLVGIKQCRTLDLPVRHLVISGGVASNQYLRSRLSRLLLQSPVNGQIALQYPPVALCTDNAVMVAWASMHRFLAGDFDDLSLAPVTKWSIEDIQTQMS